MPDLADSFEDILDAWVEKNLFDGDRYDEFDPMDAVRGAELDGIKIPGPPNEQLNHMGLSVARVAHRKNSDLRRYPFD